jgi:hypothetical protein
MRLDLAERLRCPRPHATTPLVVVASQVVERDLQRGVAGCPVCRYEARFEEGDLLGGAGESLARRTTHIIDERDPDADALDRLVALLAIDDASGAVLLTGRYGSFAATLAARTGVRVVVDGSRGSRSPEDPVCAVLGFEESIPFSDGTFHAAALGADSPPELTAEVARVVMSGGRVLGTAALPLPAGLRELARDEREWVAVRESISRPVELTRRS